MSDHQAASQASKGVETLISRLRDEGVASGRREAERLVSEAETHAREILAKADASSKAQVTSAAEEAAALRRAGEEALRIAARDAVLELKEHLARRFADEVGKVVSGTLRDEEMLKHLILAVAGRARTEGEADKSNSVEVELPRAVVGLDDLRRNPEELKAGSLTHFVAASAAGMLREGVVFTRAEGDDGGIRLKLLDRGISIDLTDKAVAHLLLAHLQPRFRALLEGVVK